MARLKSGPTFRKARLQPASHVVHHCRRPHPEVATLKELTKPAGHGPDPALGQWIAPMGASAVRLHGFYAPVGIMLDKSRVRPESAETRRSLCCSRVV